MSKSNKVNPGQYTQAGRLSPDDLARERQHAANASSERSGSGHKAPRTPDEKASAQESGPAEATANTPAPATASDDDPAGPAGR